MIWFVFRYEGKKIRKYKNHFLTPPVWFDVSNHVRGPGWVGISRRKPEVKQPEAGVKG